MFDDALNTKKLPFRVVLMDSWYATKDLILHIHRAGKFFYCPLKSNRKVDDSGGVERYKAVSSLQWSDHDAETGKLIKIHGFPGAMKVKLFRVGKKHGVRSCFHTLVYLLARANLALGHQAPYRFDTFKMPFKIGFKFETWPRSLTRSISI
jgi:hypothetical protein